MASEHEGNGYWGGYPSYLMKGGDGGNPPQDERATHPDVLIGERPGASNCQNLNAYWGFQVPFADDVDLDLVDSGKAVGSSGLQHAPSPYLQAGVRAKSRIVAGLLAIFLGCFGIHKFYLGYNSAGIIMLAVTLAGSLFSLGLAGMVVGVIGLIEGVIYLVMGQASFDRTYTLNKKEWF